MKGPIARLAVVLPMLLSLGYSNASSPTAQPESISNLSAVLQKPLEFDNAKFHGVVHVYLGEGYYGFFPRAVLSQDDVNKFDVSILPGKNGDDLSLLTNLKNGDELLVQGVLKPDRPCFVDDICTPWRHPVFIDDLRVLAVLPK